jgi:hypothetical protein
LTVKENRMMKLSSSILTGAAFALLLVGCQQDDPDPRTSDAGSSFINEDARTSQAPARDPSLPAADIYEERDGTGTTGAGTTGTDTAGTDTTMDGQQSDGSDPSAIRDQSSPDALTQEEERNDMPLPGQNSDESTRNPDQTSSR